MLYKLNILIIKYMTRNLKIYLLLFILIAIVDSCESRRGHTEHDRVYTVDPCATNETVALMKNLLKYQDTAIMFGHQDDLAYGIGWWAGEFNSDVQLVSGKFPAVFGWDAGEIGQERNIDGVLFSDMQKWMISVFDRGGINTLSFHLDNPVTGGDAWDVTPAVAAIIPGGKYHEKFRNTLDQLAVFLNGLETSEGIKVPVIFRPWHEHTGNWFWWGEGNCSKEEFKSLFRFTVEYLRDVKGIHHLLYAYSADRFTEVSIYLKNWPGDDFVDLLGYDDYHSFTDQKSIHEGIANLRIISTIAAQKNKPFALTETGLETIPIKDWWTQYVLAPIKSDTLARRISYMLVWRNGRPDHYYAPYPGQVSAENFRKFEQDSVTWFLEDLPDFY